MGQTSITLATGPVSWGVDFAGDPSNPPWQVVLDEIVESGLLALELGPIGYLPEDGEVLRDALRQRGLAAVGSFVFDDFHEPSRHGEVLAAVRRAAKTIQAAGGELLVLIDRPSGPRMRTAGRGDEAVRLPDSAWAQMIRLIDQASQIGAVHGLRTVFHPHAGGYVEFRDEVERLLEDSGVGLCLDLGHSAYAGTAPVDAIGAWRERIGHIHLKDVNPAILAQVHAAALGFWEAIGAGIFCPLGQGVVDFEAARAQLEDVGYRGFATIEQDREPGGGEPLVDLRRSIAALGSAGFEIPAESAKAG